jgi:hypothetical protein
MIDPMSEWLTYLGYHGMEDGNDALGRWLYEEGMALWRALDFQARFVQLLARLKRYGRWQMVANQITRIAP